MQWTKPSIRCREILGCNFAGAATRFGGRTWQRRRADTAWPKGLMTVLHALRSRISIDTARPSAHDFGALNELARSL